MQAASGQKRKAPRLTVHRVSAYAAHFVGFFFSFDGLFKNRRRTGGKPPEVLLLVILFPTIPILVKLKLVRNYFALVSSGHVKSASHSPPSLALSVIRRAKIIKS
jgi:hypothetical protein